jgi:hypothetical protein
MRVSSKRRQALKMQGAGRFSPQAYWRIRRGRKLVRGRGIARDDNEKKCFGGIIREKKNKKASFASAALSGSNFEASGLTLASIQIFVEAFGGRRRGKEGER